MKLHNRIEVIGAESGRQMAGTPGTSSRRFVSGTSKLLGEGSTSGPGAG